MSLTRKKYSKNVVIAANAAKTLSRDDNVNGLATAKALVNEILTDYAAHVRNYGASAGEHKALHTAGLPTSAQCGSLAAILAATNDLTAVYTLHNTDTINAAPTYHMAQDTTHALTATTTITTLAGALTRLNDIKLKFNLHSAESTAHRVGLATPITSADVSLGDTAAIIDPGIKATDTVIGNLVDDGAGNVTVVSFTVVNGALKFKASADPQDAIIAYAVVRL